MLSVETPGKGMRARETLVILATECLAVQVYGRTTYSLIKQGASAPSFSQLDRTCHQQGPEAAQTTSSVDDREDTSPETSILQTAGSPS